MSLKTSSQFLKRSASVANPSPRCVAPSPHARKKLKISFNIFVLKFTIDLKLSHVLGMERFRVIKDGSSKSISLSVFIQTQKNPLAQNRRVSFLSYYE